jgi:cyclohexanone monooxygenase
MVTSVDTEALRRKYAKERDKRLRPDGNDQYLRLTGELAHYLDDPYTPRTERAAITDHRTVVCVGGGFAGLVAAARLREAGVDVRIIEKGGGFGGTWYWNRYPGAQCDTASMVYMPLLEETGHMPTEKYVHGPEILAHCQRIGRRFGLYDDVLFHTEVTALSWDEAGARWVVETSRGDRLTAQFVVLGTGPLSVPKLPGIPGIGTFRGHSFHTSRWDYAYTGGDYSGAVMDKLADKRVGLIGTGATAVQCVPHLARDARKLYVFQRTPSSVDTRGNHADRPGLVRRDRHSGLAAALAGELHRQPGRRRRGRGPGAGRLDRHRPPDPRPDRRAAAGVAQPGGDARRLRGVRLREDGGDPRRADAIVRDQTLRQR